MGRLKFRMIGLAAGVAAVLAAPAAGAPRPAATLPETVLFGVAYYDEYTPPSTVSRRTHG